MLCLIIFFVHIRNSLRCRACHYFFSCIFKFSKFHDSHTHRRIEIIRFQENLSVASIFSFLPHRISTLQYSHARHFNLYSSLAHYGSFVICNSAKSDKISCVARSWPESILIFKLDIMLYKRALTNSMPIYIQKPSRTQITAQVEGRALIILHHRNHTAGSSSTRRAIPGMESTHSDTPRYCAVRSI